MKKMLPMLFKATTMLAFVFTVLNVNAACAACFHQEKLPEAAMKYKR